MGESIAELRKEYKKLLNEWYDHDQHFESPLLDRLHVLKKEIKERENCIKEMNEWMTVEDIKEHKRQKRHSKKPDFFQDLIETVSEEPRLEVENSIDLSEYYT